MEKTSSRCLDFFRSIDLEVIDFDLVKAQGGSIRVYVGHQGMKVKKKKINKQINIEKKFGLFSNQTFFNYFKRINIQKNKIQKIISKNIKKDKIFIGYGAPAKVTTFCHVFKIGRDEIKYIVDDNDLKQGKFTPGKNIKIIKFKELKDTNFDFIINCIGVIKPLINKNLYHSIYINSLFPIKLSSNTVLA